MPGKRFRVSNKGWPVCLLLVQLILRIRGRIRHSTRHCPSPARGAGRSLTTQRTVYVEFGLEIAHLLRQPRNAGLSRGSPVH